MAKMGTIFGLAAAAGAVWWLTRKKAPSLPVVSEANLPMNNIQSASEDTLAGLKVQGIVPPDAVDVYLVPNFQYPLAAVAGRPNVYAVPAAMAGGAGGGMATIAGFGAHPLTVMRTTPNFRQPRPGSLTMMTTPRLPSPRSLSGGLGFGQPVGWRAGQLYQPGTHDTSSGVTGLWY